MDGDDFSRVTRLGRTVAEGVIRVATNGAPFDEFPTRQLFDQLVEVSDGIPSLSPVLKLLSDWGSQPLLLLTRRDEAVERVNEIMHGPRCGMLDLQLGKVAQSAILRGQTDPAAIVERFLRALVERHVIMGRGGLVDIDGPRHVERARELTAPIAREAATKLIGRPNAKRLGLSRAFHITESSNLLGAT
jgi:hypothetical protein